MISASAFLVVVLTVAGPPPNVTCQSAIKDLSAHLPELSTTDAEYRWRGLPTAFQCDAHGAGKSISLRWKEGQGLLSDARAAIGALGSRMTGDTATAIRGAFDRCISAAGRSLGENSQTMTGSTSVSCTVNSADAVVVVERRRDR